MELHSTQKAARKIGVTIRMRNTMAASRITIVPIKVALRTFFTSLLRSLSRLNSYRAKIEKTMCHENRSKRKRTMLFIFTCIYRKLAKDTVAFSCHAGSAARASEMAAAPMSNNMNALVRT